MLLLGRISCVSRDEQRGWRSRYTFTANFHTLKSCMPLAVFLTRNWTGPCVKHTARDEESFGAGSYHPRKVLPETACAFGTGGESQRQNGVADDNLVRPALKPEYYYVPWKWESFSSATSQAPRPPRVRQSLPTSRVKLRPTYE